MKSIFLFGLLAITNIFGQDLPCKCIIGRDTLSGEHTYQAFDKNENELTFIRWNGDDTLSHYTFQYDSKDRVIEKKIIQSEGDSINKTYRYNYSKNYNTTKTTYQYGIKTEKTSFKDYYYLYRDRIDHINEKGHHVTFIFEDTLLKKIETKNNGDSLIFSVRFLYNKNKLIKEIHFDHKENCIVKEVDYDWNGNKSLIIERPFGHFFYVTSEFHLYDDLGLVSSTGYFYEGQNYGYYHKEFEKVECIEKIKAEKEDCEAFVEQVKAKLIGKWEFEKYGIGTKWDNAPDSILIQDDQFSRSEESLFKAKEIEFKIDGTCLIDNEKSLHYEVSYDPKKCNPHSEYNYGRKHYLINLIVGESIYVINSNPESTKQNQNKLDLTSEYPASSHTRYLIRR